MGTASTAVSTQQRIILSKNNENTSGEQSFPSKFLISKERKVGNSQEGRLNISTKSAREGHI